MGRRLAGSVGAGRDGVADGAHSFDTIGDRHFVRRRDLLFPRRTDGPTGARLSFIFLSDRLRVNIRFLCPVCECPGQVRPPDRNDWQCPQCDHLVQAAAVDFQLPTCTLCGCHELYKKKDFPHKLGMGILVVACLASSLTTLFYQWYWTWGILIGSAAF